MTPHLEARLGARLVECLARNRAFGFAFGERLGRCADAMLNLRAIENRETAFGGAFGARLVECLVQNCAFETAFGERLGQRL